MDRNSEEATERVIFEVTGELAEWIQDMKRRGFFYATPEIVRLSLTLLRHHYRQRLGVTVERETKESEGH